MYFQPPSKNFVGRQKEINIIHETFIRSKVLPKRMVVLTGMPGIGKTQIARKYADEYQRCYDYIVWIDASFNALKDSLKDFAHTIGIKVQDISGVYFKTEVISKMIHNHFRNGRSLYVYDQVDDVTVQDFEKYVDHHPNSFTIVTSQWNCWSSESTVIKINSFSPVEAMTFLQSQLLNQSNERLQEIAAMVWFHPQALHQVIMYLNTSLLSTLDEFIINFQADPIAFLTTKSRKETQNKCVVK